MSALGVLLLLASAGGSDAKRLYDDNCAACHAVDGSGSGRGASFLRPLKYGRKRDTLVRIIRDGIPKTMMPASGLSGREISTLADYVLKLNTRAKERR